MADGIRTPDLALASAFDEFLVNKTANGVVSTGRAPLDQTASLLLASTAFTPIVEGVRLLPVSIDTWASLLATTPLEGQTGYVTATDDTDYDGGGAGTHTDPVTSATGVANKGIYRGVKVGGVVKWKWIGEFGESSTDVRSDVGSNPNGLGQGPTLFETAADSAAFNKGLVPNDGRNLFNTNTGTTGAQRDKALGNTDGAVTTLVGFMVPGKQAGVPGGSYVYSLDAAPSAIVLNLASGVHYYDANGVWISRDAYSGSGWTGTTWTMATDSRSIAVTLPAGAFFWQPLVKYAADNGVYNSSNPTSIDADLFNEVINSTMINVGTLARLFVPYDANAPALVLPKTVDPAKRIRAMKSGDNIYMRSPTPSGVKDRVRRITLGDVLGLARNGHVNPFSCVLIDPSKSDDETPGAMAAVLAGAGSDVEMFESDSVPVFEPYLNIALTGNHGIDGWNLNSAAHGLTVSDVGKEYDDSASQRWVFVGAYSADVPTFMRKPGGTATLWLYSTAKPAAGDLVAVVGGAHLSWTDDSADPNPKTKLVQLVPSQRDHEKTASFDGVEALDGEIVACSSVEITDTYVVTNYAAVYAYIVANPGVAASYNDPDIAAQLEMSYTWHFSDAAAGWLDCSIYALQEIALFWYLGFSWHALWFVSGSGETLNQFVNRCEPFTTSGTDGSGSYSEDWDFGSLQNVSGTFRTPLIAVAAASWTDPDLPPNVGAQVVKNDDGDPVRAFGWYWPERYDDDRKLASAAYRTSGTAKKQYGSLAGNGTPMAAEDLIEGRSGFAFYDPTLDPHTPIAFTVPDGDEFVHCWHCFSNLGEHVIPLAAIGDQFRGWDCSILATDPGATITLKSKKVQANGIRINVAAAGGIRVRLKRSS
jgi:hypothetical protein